MTVTQKNVATKYRQGRGWVVSSYCPQYKAWSTSQEMTYRAACQAVAEARKNLMEVVK